ncbi:hypothetical protein AB3S75_023424 [Citrus x aurantiifolia]
MNTNGEANIETEIFNPNTLNKEDRRITLVPEHKTDTTIIDETHFNDERLFGKTYTREKRIQSKKDAAILPQRHESDPIPDPKNIDSKNSAGLHQKARGKAFSWCHCFGVAQECNIGEIPEEEEPPAKSLKDKKANGPDYGKAPSLVFKITSKIPYKTVLKAHNAVVLKAESTADKAEWINKISKVIQARGGLVRVAESGHTMRQSLSDGSLTC